LTYRDLANANGEVEPVVNHVAEPVTYHKFDLQTRMIGEQIADVAREGGSPHRDTHPHEPDR